MTAGEDFTLVVREHWFKLPMKLRRRYWQETEYGRQPPSAELRQAIVEALKAALQQSQSGG